MGAITASQIDYQPQTPDRLLTVQQAAQYVPCSVQTIRRAYVLGQLVVERFGRGFGRVRIRQQALEAWLKNGGKTEPAYGDGRPTCR
jgi:excisionase family DNA binding protein